MNYLRHVALGLSASIALGVVVLAETEWKTVTLRGEKGLTISIPTVARDYDRVKGRDDLMFLSLTVPGDGSLTCFASRDEYPKNSSQAAFAAALATERREIFCGMNGTSISQLEIGGSKSFTQNGMQAAICTASYTDSAEKLPGRVRSQMVIAAPKKVYFLTCTVEDEDQDTAQYEWSSFWGATVTHIQESFHVPQ